MKKTKRKRLELEREVVVLLAAIPAANRKYVQGGTVEELPASEVLGMSCIVNNCIESSKPEGCLSDQFTLC
jgi:hypothetical protein